MIPRKLQLRNFMCYREDVPPLDFDGLSIACLSGENGAGKSSLLDALTWSLWGQARLKSDDDLIALGATEMEVDLTFTLDGQDYRVVRKRSKGKRGQTWLDFQVRNGDGWKQLTGAGIRETQETITRTLRMGYETFSNSAFLRQGHADEFTRKKPAERKAVLAEILGLDIYEELETASKERARGIDGQIRGLEGKIEAFAHEAQQQESRAALVAAAETQVTQLETQIQAAEQALQEAEQTLRQLEALRPLRDEHRTQLQRRQNERERLVAEIENRRRELANDQAVTVRRDEILAGVAALQAAKDDLELLEGLRANYDQLLSEQHSAAQALRNAEHALQTDLQVAEGELKGLRERAARRPALEQEIGKLETALARTATIDQELRETRARRTELQNRQNDVHELQIKKKDAEQAIAIKHDSLVATREEWKRQIRDASERLKHVERTRSDRERAATERSHLEQETQRMEALRIRESELVALSGELRADCATIKNQGEEINKKLEWFRGNPETCPLCGNQLGHDGITHIEDEYNQQRDDLRQQYRTKDRQAKEVDGNITSLRAEIQVLDRRAATLPELAGRIAQLDAELRAADELRQTQANLQRELSALELQLLKGDFEREARAESARIDAALAGLGDSKALARDISRMDERSTKLEQQAAEHTRQAATLSSLRRELAALDAEADTLTNTSRRVASLRVTLERNDFAHTERAAVTAVQEKITALGYSPEQHKAAREQQRLLAVWDEEARKLERAETNLGHNTALLERDLKTLEQADAESAEAKRRLDELELQLRGLYPAQQERDAATRSLRDLRSEFQVRQRDLGEKRANLRRSEDAAVQLKTTEKERDRYAKRKGLFDELSGAFGKKGIQAMLIETAIPEIEHEANALLTHMTDNQMHLTFETQRDTKKGDISETLDIKISDALGIRDYDAYSGGESFRVDFAIRIALAKLLARRAGARLETLVIDEGFGSQDAKGRERLVEAITSIQPDFKQILVVTHIQELKDMFPNYIEITKTPAGSVWALG